jgi:hypothetical protein
VTGSIGLGHNMVHDLGPGRVAVHFLSNPDLDGQPVRVELAVAPHGGGEFDVTLRLGERFSIGAESWVFERVENLGTYDYTVWLASVPAPEPPPVGDSGRGWAERVADVLEFVRFEARLDGAVVNKVAEAIVRSRMLHEPPARMAEAIAAGLDASVALTSLAPVGFPEPELREFLRRLAARLDALRPWPVWLFEQADMSVWGSAPVRPLAYLDLSPVRLTNLLGVLFERVVEDGKTMEIAVLRLAAGPLVALAREVGSRSTGTLLLQQGAERAEPAAAEVLRANGIGADSIRWVGDAVPDVPA